MVAILGGLGAASAWALTALASSRSARAIGSASVLAWVMLTGLAVTLPWALASGVPDALDGDSTGWLLAAGVGNVVGLLLVYEAFRAGQVSVVAPIVSTEGALAAVFAVTAGEDLGAGVGAALAVVAVGVALAGFSANAAGPGSPSLRAPVLALAAALSFGTSLYATGRLGDELPVAWALLPPRVIGVAAIALPLLATRRLRITRPVLPLVLAAGVAEVVGFSLYVVGARDSIAIAAVLASQFGALAALVAYYLFRERLTRLQVAGVAAIAAGVAVLSALQA